MFVARPLLAAALVAPLAGDPTSLALAQDAQEAQPQIVAAADDAQEQRHADLAAAQAEILAALEEQQATLAAHSGSDTTADADVEALAADAKAKAEAALADSEARLDAAAAEGKSAVSEADKDAPALVHTGELPVAPPPVIWASRGVFDLVPADTATAFHKRSHDGSALADAYAVDVVEAICDAEFDEFLFSTLETAGAPPELVSELRGYRNLVSTFAGAMPWDAVLGREFVWAESGSSAFGTEAGMPGMLLVSRPGTHEAEQVERSLAMLLGALTTASPIHARLDIEELPSAGGPSTTHYALRVALENYMTVLQMAVRDDTIMLGLGDAYFADALRLLRDEDAPRLLATQRFQDAIGLLPPECTATHYVDVKRQVDTVEGVMALVQDRSFNTGYWQTTLNDTLRLYDHIETVATATRCDGRDVVMETVTRFDPEATQHNPVYQLGLAKRASPELLDYVPADAVAFAMQGEVEVAPIFRAFMSELETRYDWGAPLLMGARVLGAAADFSVERDVLSWVGSEHITITLPSRARHAQKTDVETVTIWKLDDPAGMKKCLARLEAVYNELVPPLLGEMQAKLTQAESPIVPDIQLAASEGMFPSLRKLELTGLPMPLPALHFGVLGDSFVMAPSQESLESCLAAAAFMEPGLEERPLAEHLIGRSDLTGARLEPYGKGTQEWLQLIMMMQAFVLPTVRGAVADTEYAWAADSADDLLGRVTGVLQSIDFLGDAVTWSERRAGGLVQYECTKLQLAPGEVESASASDPLVSR